MEDYSELVGKSYYDFDGTYYTVIHLGDDSEYVLYAVDPKGNIECQNAIFVKSAMEAQGVLSGDKKSQTQELGSWDLIELTAGWRPELLKD